VANEKPAPINLDDLPYMEDYLREVLRPRVEVVLGAIEASLVESVWRKLVRGVAGDKPGVSEASQAMIRSLIAERLGLKLGITLDREFRPERAGDASGGANRAEDSDHPTPTIVPAAVRRPSGAMPLVNAVLGGRRPPVR